MNEELYHHGILGQKWGIRRFQNPDGTLTEAGKKRQQKLINKANEYADKINKKYDRYKENKNKKVTLFSPEIDLEYAILHKQQYDALIEKAEKMCSNFNKRKVKDVALTTKDYLDLAKYMNRYNPFGKNKIEQWEKELSDAEIQNKVNKQLQQQIINDHSLHAQMIQNQIIQQQIQQQMQMQIQQQIQQQIQHQIQTNIQNQMIQQMHHMM